MIPITVTEHLVLGMAKSSLDLRGGKSRNLELDFLRLSYACLRLSNEKRKVSGVLCVVASEVHTTCAAWSKKYEAADHVTVHCATLTSEELSNLEAEKARNAAGIAGEDAEDSIASYGKELAEHKLEEFIAKTFGNVEKSDFRPLTINWDFVGIVKR